MYKIAFRNIASKLGIDKAIFFTSLARIIQATGGVVSVLFVARFLTGVEQGFYYTFGSIVAIQIFFELGFNGIITQYVAHETSHLKWSESGIELKGESKYLSRLSSLLHLSIKWYSRFAIILFITLLVVGFMFFTKYSSNEDTVMWKTPWILLAITTTINLLIIPVLAFFEGLGKVKNVAKIRLCQQTIGLLFIWGGFFLGAKLYVPAINGVITVIIALLLIWFNSFFKILSYIWKIPIVEKVNYRKEIFPYQWKIALSWISGYFIFQLFNPVLFAFDGAIVAGQMGMTLAALNGIQSLSLSWMTTKVPLYSGLIAQKKYNELNSIFDITLKQSVFINGAALFFMFIVIFVIRHFHLVIAGLDLSSRFLDYLPMLLMMIPLFVNQYVVSWATYLRCHKKEPYLNLSIVLGSMCCLSTILLGKYYGVIGVTSGYCLITLFSVPWAYSIFKTKRKEWHEK